MNTEGKSSLESKVSHETKTAPEIHVERLEMEASGQIKPFIQDVGVCSKALIITAFEKDNVLGVEFRMCQGAWCKYHGKKYDLLSHIMEAMNNSLLMGTVLKSSMDGLPKPVWKWCQKFICEREVATHESVPEEMKDQTEGSENPETM
jgi:hypothetical protein